MDLDPENTIKLKSGSLLAGYLLVFKGILKAQFKIGLNISEASLRKVKESSTHYTDVKSNWIILLK